MGPPQATDPAAAPDGGHGAGRGPGRAAAAGTDDPVRAVRVWDPALRLFHWALVVAVATAWGLGEFGPAIMTWHVWAGYAVCGLVLFRVLWGVAGPRTARFAAFLAGPRAVARYAATLPLREPSRWPGHSPLGGWAVVAMLLLLAAQAGTGLVSDPEDYINVGPLAHLVSPETSRAANGWHAWLSRALLALVALHVAVVLFYRLWKREDLIGPMIHGRKRVR